MMRWLLLALSMLALFAPPISLAQAEERHHSSYEFPFVETDAEGNPDFSKLEWVANDNQEGNSTPLCQAVFAELKKGDDVRVNLPDFPRTPKTQSGLARIKWQNLDPQANFSTVMDILSYRFKNNDYEVNGEVPTTTDGVEQLKSSYILKKYQTRAKEGLLVLQQAFFDADGDGVKDRVLRMGVKMHYTGGVISKSLPVRIRQGDIPSFQFMIYFRDGKGQEIRSGFDIDDGNIGERYRSVSLSAFEYKSIPFFFTINDGFTVFSISNRQGSSVKFGDRLCDFYLSPKAGEQK